MFTTIITIISYILKNQIFRKIDDPKLLFYSVMKLMKLFFNSSGMKLFLFINPTLIILLHNEREPGLEVFNTGQITIRQLYHNQNFIIYILKKFLKMVGIFRLEDIKDFRSQSPSTNDKIRAYLSI